MKVACVHTYIRVRERESKRERKEQIYGCKFYMVLPECASSLDNKLSFFYHTLHSKVFNLFRLFFVLFIYIHTHTHIQLRKALIVHVRCSIYLLSMVYSWISLALALTAYFSLFRLLNSLSPSTNTPTPHQQTIFLMN